MLALLLLAAEAVVLRDDVNVVPPGEWRYDEFVVKEQVPATVACAFHQEGQARARVELVSRQQLDSLLKGQAHDVIVESRESGFSQQIRQPGSYALVLVNEDKTRPARVALKLTLDFSAYRRPSARYLSPERRLTVILLSFVGFLAIVTLSARKLLRAMRPR